MVDLNPGEVVVRTGSVEFLAGGAPHQGTLTLTNRAVIFEGPLPQVPPGGPVPRPVPFAPGVRRIPLWRCQRALSSPGPMGGPRLELDLLQRSIFFRTNDPEGWAAAVNKAKLTAPPSPPGAIGGPVGAGGIAAARAAMPKCEYCGNLNAPMATHCKTCGAPLSA